MEVCDSDRVRISNIIWRSWHIKFQHNSLHSSRNSPFLDFTIPDLDTTHKHSESVVLEGQYWCRKNVRVALEYSNWRQEFRNSKRFVPEFSQCLIFQMNKSVYQSKYFLKFLCLIFIWSIFI